VCCSVLQYVAESFIDEGQLLRCDVEMFQFGKLVFAMLDSGVVQCVACVTVCCNLLHRHGAAV